MRAILLLLSLSLLLGGCQSPSPGLSLTDARVVEGPVLIERSGHIYLRYRRALEERTLTLASVLYHRKTTDAVYYFFSVPISHTEWGNVIERPLGYDGAEELARQGRVFWLDPDGTTHPIPLKNEERNPPPGPAAAKSEGVAPAPRKTPSVQVEGAVGNPGPVSFPAKRGLSIVDAITLGGGPTRMADLKRVLLIRANLKGEPETTVVDVDAMLKGRVPSGQVLQDGDRIVVPSRNGG